MTYITFLALALIGLFALAAWLAIWSRSDTKGRAMSVALMFMGIPVVAAASMESLGFHKPLALAWDLKPGEHRILAAVMVQDYAIYIYVDDPARIEPRPLVLPWSNDLASRLQAALDGAPDGSEGQALLLYEPSMDYSETVFHAIPQPPSPPAKEAPSAGLTFEHRE